MKKSLIALAALAAVSAASAQSTVTISGLVDIGYGTVNGPANVLGNQTGDISRVAQNGSATTALIFGGSEDLGGGMKANFRLELNPDFVNGTALTGGAGVLSGAGVTSLGNGANGYSFVGVSSASLGEIKFGRLNTGTLAAWGAGSVFGTALGSGYSSSAIYTRYSTATANYNNTAPTRFNGAVEYTTPKVANLTARALYVPQVNKVGVGGETACTDATTCVAGTANTIGANRAGVTDISVAYSAGPLNVVVASQTVKVGSGDVSALVSPALNSIASTSTKLNTLGANYTLGAIRGFAAYWTNKTGTTVNDSGLMLGAKYTMGAVDLSASMGRLNDKLAANVDRKILGLGVDYNLSKRSAIYARHESRDANTNSGADTAAAGSTKTTHVGVRHTF